MKNFSQLLQDIKAHPVRYLGKPSITCLHSFLVGYLGTLRDLGFTHESGAMKGFQEWMQEQEKTTVCRSWDAILLFTHGGEKSCLYIFFELFDEFLSRHEISQQKIGNGEKFSSSLNDLRLPTYDCYDDLLKGIKKRPGMYLGTSSITKLDMLLRGCSLARREVGIAPTNSEREFAGFQSWLQEKYGIKTNQSWAKIILFYSIDEQEALGKFFELYEEYLNRDKSSEVDSSSGEKTRVLPSQANQIG